MATTIIITNTSSSGDVDDTVNIHGKGDRTKSRSCTLPSWSMLALESGRALYVCRRMQALPRVVRVCFFWFGPYGLFETFVLAPGLTYGTVEAQ